MTHRCTQHRSSPSCTDSRRKMFDFSSQSSCLGRRRVDAPRGLQSAVCNFQRSFSAPSTARRRQHGPYEGRRRASLHDVSAHRPHLARDEQDFRAIAITFPGGSYLKGPYKSIFKIGLKTIIMWVWPFHLISQTWFRAQAPSMGGVRPRLDHPPSSQRSRTEKVQFFHHLLPLLNGQRNR